MRKKIFILISDSFRSSGNNPFLLKIIKSLSNIYLFIINYIMYSLFEFCPFCLIKLINKYIFHLVIVSMMVLGIR